MRRWMTPGRAASDGLPGRGASGGLPARRPERARGRASAAFLLIVGVLCGLATGAGAAERLAGLGGRAEIETRGGPATGPSPGSAPARAPGPETFVAGPGLTMHRDSGRLVDVRGEMVAEIGPDWTHAAIDAVSLKYSLLDALGARIDGRVSVRSDSGRQRFVEGEVLTAVFESARRGSAVVLALDALGRIYKLRTPITVSPGWRLKISLKVSPAFGEDHLILVVGHSVALLSQTLAPMQGQALDATKVVDVLSALGDGSVAMLPVLTSAR